MIDPENDDELHRLRLRNAELERENEALRSANGARAPLAGILSSCASCRKIRDNDEWTPLETYLRARFAVDFSHSLCPSCAPDFGLPDD